MCERLTGAQVLLSVPLDCFEDSGVGESCFCLVACFLVRVFVCECACGGHETAEAGFCGVGSG